MEKQSNNPANAGKQVVLVCSDPDDVLAAMTRVAAASAPEEDQGKKTEKKPGQGWTPMPSSFFDSGAIDGSD